MGKHMLFLSRMFSFKNQNRSKTQSVLTGAGREEVLAGCMCAIFGLTHGRQVSWSLLRMPPHHRRLPGRRTSGWQTLSTRAVGREMKARVNTLGSLLKEEGRAVGKASSRYIWTLSEEKRQGFTSNRVVMGCFFFFFFSPIAVSFEISWQF